MQAEHFVRFAWRSIVWRNGRWFRSLLAILTEWISETGVGFLELPFTGFATGRRLEFPIRLEQHSLALRLEVNPGTLQLLEPIESGAEFAL